MRKTKIGVMDFHGSVDITDPCYDKDVWCRMNNVKISEGEYACYVWRHTDKGKYEDGTPYSYLLVGAIGIYRNGDIPRQKDMEEIGSIGVDAGLAGFFHNKPDYSDEEWGRFCDRVSLLVGALYNIVDQIFIGWGVGYLGNGATNVVFPLTVLALGLAVMIGDGACSYVSICFGRNQPESANRAVGSAVTLSVLVGIAAAVLYAVFQMPLLTLFGATEANFGYAKEYFTCITIGIPIYVFGQAINPIIRSDGSPQFAMFSMLAGAAANCILDPIAIFVLHWGVMGAAAATVAGQVITAAMGVWYLLHTKALRLKADDFKLRGKILGAYLPLGLCSFLAQISLVIAMAATNNMLVRYGASSKYGADIPLTVLGIVMKVFQIIISITIGMAAGCIPIVGYNYGAQLLRRCRSVLWRLMGAEFLLGVLALLITQLFPRQIIGLFGSESELYNEFAVMTFRVYLCMLPLATVNKAAFIFMQAMGRPVESAGLSFFREVLLAVPLVMLLPRVFGLMGVLYSMPVADILTFFASCFVLLHTDRQLRK